MGGDMGLPLLLNTLVDGTAMAALHLHDHASPATE